MQDIDLEGVAANRPEESAILSCASMLPEEERLRRISAAFNHPHFEWERLVRLALAHGMLPPIEDHLGRLETVRVPPEIAESIRQKGASNTWRSIQLMRMLLQLTSQFERSGIQAVPFKGPAVATLAYQRITLRPFSDLDLLVREESLPALCNSLTGMGYDLLRGSGMRAGHYSFLNPDSLRVEVHTPSTIATAWCVEFDFSGAWTRLGRYNIWGSPVLGFSREDLFLLLCIHGDKHCWKGVRWIGDIARFLTRVDLDWTAVADLARGQGIEDTLRSAICLACGLLHASIPVELETAVPIQLDSRTRELAAFLFVDPERLSNQMKRVRFGFSRLSSFPARKNYLINLLAPRPVDREWLRLPESLAPVYPVLRLLRLATKSLVPARKRAKNGTLPHRSAQDRGRGRKDSRMSSHRQPFSRKSS